MLEQTLKAMSSCIDSLSVRHAEVAEYLTSDSNALRSVMQKLVFVKVEVNLFVYTFIIYIKYAPAVGMNSF